MSLKSAKAWNAKNKERYLETQKRLKLINGKKYAATYNANRREKRKREREAKKHD